MRRIVLIGCILSASMFASGRRAWGDPLTVVEANVITSSMTFDQDLFLTTFIPSATGGGVADFDGVLTDAGWSGLLAGDFLGRPLAVEHSGDSSAYSTSGLITWNSSGTYGADAWAGSGSVTFTQVNPDDFSATYTSTLNIGVNSISYTGAITGSLTSAGGLTANAVGSATITIGPTPPFVVDTLFVVERAARDNTSYLSWLRRARRGINLKDQAELEADRRYRARMTIVPEPSSLIPMGVAGSFLLAYSGRRWRRSLAS